MLSQSSYSTFPYFETLCRRSHMQSHLRQLLRSLVCPISVSEKVGQCSGLTSGSGLALGLGLQVRESNFRLDYRHNMIFNVQFCDCTMHSINHTHCIGQYLCLKIAIGQNNDSLWVDGWAGPTTDHWLLTANRNLSFFGGDIAVIHVLIQSTNILELF